MDLTKHYEAAQVGGPALASDGEAVDIMARGRSLASGEDMCFVVGSYEVRKSYQRPVPGATNT